MKKNSLMFFTVLTLANIMTVSYAQEIGEAQPGKPKVEVTMVETDLEEADAYSVDIAQGLDAPVQDFSPAKGVDAPSGMKGDVDIEGVKLGRDRIIETNWALKRMIEENDKLEKETRRLNTQLNNIKGQRRIEVNRVESLIKERDAYKDRMEEVRQYGEKIKENGEKIQLLHKAKFQEYARSVKELKDKLAKQEAALEDVRPKLEDVQKEKEAAVISSQESVLASQELSMDVLNMVDDLNKQQWRIKRDKAKVHYNMGNIFFKQGKYRKSVDEYKKALKLNPQDANAHFNLAFISGNYMNDYKTALDHYHQYLIINPHAEDAVLVNEKILEAEIFLKSRVDSSLEDDLVNERNRFIWRNN